MHLRQGAMQWWAPVTVDFINATPKETHHSYATSGTLEPIDIRPLMNAQLRKIFDQRYLTPRPVGPTLQLPVQGIGNWAYPLVKPAINDSGLKAAAHNSILRYGDSLRFRLQTDSNAHDILFTSMWDNYPDSASIALQGKARKAYLLMSGTTNAMQSRFLNGKVEVRYTDGSSDLLELRNPQNWWPIEQDYLNDGYAFTTDAPLPMRISLSTGRPVTPGYRYTSIKGYSGRAIEGGAATILKMNLNPDKTLDRLILHTIANDVVIGLMALTLER
jgi:hypothetical protein